MININITNEKNIPKERYWLNKYFYVEKCWEQAWSYFAEPKQLVTDFMILSIFLSQKGINDTFKVVVIFLIGIFVMLSFGHFTLKRRWMHWKKSFDNFFNPEITAIHKATKVLKRDIK